MKSQDLVVIKRYITAAVAGDALPSWSSDERAELVRLCGEISSGPLSEEGLRALANIGNHALRVLLGKLQATAHAERAVAQMVARDGPLC